MQTALRMCETSLQGSAGRASGMGAIFYTGLKVIDGRLRTPESLPDWILPESASGLSNERLLAIPGSVKPYYDVIRIRVHNSGRLDNVPEPDCYQYGATSKLTDFLAYRKRM